MAAVQVHESGSLAKLSSHSWGMEMGEFIRAATMGEFLDLELAKELQILRRGLRENVITLKTASDAPVPCAGGALVDGDGMMRFSLAYSFGAARDCLQSRTT